MNYFANLGRALLGSLSFKSSAVGPMLARLMLGQPVWPKRDFEKLGREGYQQNPVVHACIALIAKSVADISWAMYQGAGEKRKEIDDHPLLDLMDQPNPEQDRTAFLTALISYRLIAGNAYIERTDEKKLERMELYAHRPDRMRVVPGEFGIPQAYQYRVGTDTKTFEVDIDAGVRPILHLKDFNPVDDWYGLSPLDACAWAIDIHNASFAWNKSLLDNSGAPSGAFVYAGTEASGTNMSQEMYDRIQDRMRDMKPGQKLILEGGLDWKQMGFNAEQMGQHEAINNAARTIAFTLGVPPELVGIPGDKTFANYAEARLSFYQETVIPAARETCRQMQGWFGPKLLGKGVTLEPNLDKIDALQAVRVDHWERVEKSTVLSLNEKREELGYEPVDGGDDHYVSAGQLPVGSQALIDTANGQEEQPPAAKKPPAKKHGVYSSSRRWIDHHPVDEHGRLN